MSHKKINTKRRKPTNTDKKANQKKRRKIKISILEQSSISDIELTRNAVESERDYYWKERAELAAQRNSIQEEIKMALISASAPYEFNRFQRAFRWKYSNKPLSTEGSRNGIGGRFNIGSKLNPELPSFSGLYLAEDQDTALQELLQSKEKNRKGFNPYEIVLANQNSISIVSISGRFDKMFDLTITKNLTEFVKLIKGFKISSDLLRLRKKLNIQDPHLITTNSALKKNLLDSNWQLNSALYDIPSNSQIFGHLIYNAGIEGIIYPSKYTGRSCAVVFPKNFKGTDSFITLDDDAPSAEICIRVDANNCEEYG